VSYNQFQREYRFIGLLRMTDSKLATRFNGPLPQPGLDWELVRTLCESHGWTEERIRLEFDVRELPRDWLDSRKGHERATTIDPSEGCDRGENPRRSEEELDSLNAQALSEHPNASLTAEEESLELHDPAAVDESLTHHDHATVEESLALHDPAANRLLMDRLELLLDLLVMSRWDEPPDAVDRLPVEERQTFAHLKPEIPIRFWRLIRQSSD
jgi:hypothetical protein